jgi:hypothetical protein
LNSTGNIKKIVLKSEIDANEDSAEPFTWCLPIDIIPLKYPLDVSGEVSACLDPVSEYIQTFS